jgi:hypothetical protein
LATGVDSDADCWRQFAWDASFLELQCERLFFPFRRDMSYLQLSESESTTSAHTAVVLDSRAAHDRSQPIDGTRSDFGSFRNASLTAALLAAGLV